MFYCSQDEVHGKSVQDRDQNQLEDTDDEKIAVGDKLKYGNFI